MNKNTPYTFATAQASMAEPLKALWQEAFGDEKAYIDFFFANRFRPEETVVCLADHLPVAAAYCLRISVMPGKHPARYVYAVAVRREYRRQGIAANLLRFAYQTFKEPLILEPADDKLLHYYEKLGFRKAFYVNEYELPAEGGLKEKMPELSAVRSCSAKTYKQLRDMYFEAPYYVQWDETGIAYALSENEFCGGRAYEVHIKNRTGILLLRPAGEQLRIMETTLTDEELRLVLTHLKVADRTALVRRRAVKMRKTETDCVQTQNTGQERCIGLLYDKDGQEDDGQERTSVKGYLNLTLE